MRLVSILFILSVGCSGIEVGGTDDTASGFDTETEVVPGTSSIEQLGTADGCDDPDHVVTSEICDHLDNDCDGTVDEGAADAPTWYIDFDGDGSGNSAVTTRACSQPDGYVDGVGDCNDDDPTVFTGAPELCDGLDNDCDGEVDDNCVGFFVGCLLVGR